MKKERNPHPSRPINCQRDQLRQKRILKALDKSTAAGQRKSKVRASHTDYRYHCRGHYSPRYLDGAWGMRVVIHRSVLGRRSGVAIWKQPEGPKVQCIMNWRVLCHSQSNARGSHGPQDKTRDHCWGG